MTTPLACKLGQLARSCEICELERENAALRAENAALRVERQILRTEFLRLLRIHEHRSPELALQILDQILDATREKTK